jgi:tetratricopeptide (TPR) repeat protein
MYQRDYIMRMIEQLTAGIARIAGLRQEKKHQEALATADELLTRLFRMNGNLLRSLSARNIIEMMRMHGHLETEPLKAMARLLKEEGDIYLQMGRFADAYHSHLKALDLLLAAAPEEDDSDGMDLRREIEELLHRLGEYVLPADTLRELCSYYEQTGQYAKAEDIWYELLEQKENEPEFVQETVQFYRRLLRLSDEQLESGRLPRAEVEAGLEQLRQYMLSDASE